MAGYITFWSKDRVRALEKAGDEGPLKVIYGSQHTQMPAISSVRVGDILYPVALRQGTLCCMARLPVERIEPAFDYLFRETGARYHALVPEGFAVEELGARGSSCFIWSGPLVWKETDLPEGTKIFYLKDSVEIPHQAHQIPQTCCAKLAASGSQGSAIFPRPISVEWIPELRFGPSKSKQKPLRINAKGSVTSLSLSGFLRKTSVETQARFESLFEADGMRCTES